MLDVPGRNAPIEKLMPMTRKSPTTTKMMVEGGVTTQYDQKIVRLMRRSKASPEAACVIYVIRRLEFSTHIVWRQEAYLRKGEGRW